MKIMTYLDVGINGLERGACAGSYCYVYGYDSPSGFIARFDFFAFLCALLSSLVSSLADLQAFMAGLLACLLPGSSEWEREFFPLFALSCSFFLACFLSSLFVACSCASCPARFLPCLLACWPASSLAGCQLCNICKTGKHFSQKGKTIHKNRGLELLAIAYYYHTFHDVLVLCAYHI